MKVSIFTTVIPDMTPEEAATALQAAGYDGAEWRVTVIPEEVRKESPSFWRNNYCTFAPTRAEAVRARHISEGAQLEIPFLGSYVSVGDLKGTERAIDFAKNAGTGAIRVGVSRLGGTSSYGDAVQQTRSFLMEAEGLARPQGIKLMIETHHGTVIPSASATIRLVEGFDPEWLGVIYDPGNMMREGYEDYHLGVEVLGPYLAHVHLKNARYVRPDDGGVWQAEWSPMEDGILDFRALFTALHQGGYDGWLGVEDFSNARPTQEMLEYNIQFIRNLWGEVAEG